MKRSAVAIVMMAFTFIVPGMMAQGKGGRDHIELGAFADYVRLQNAGDAGFWGLGGRLGFGMTRHFNLEADMAYDFEKNVTVTGTGTNAGFSTTFTQINGLRLWHGEFGPMIWFGSKHARVFAQFKGGFLNSHVSVVSPVTGFTSVVGTFFTSNTSGVFYPGGGAEVSLGPFGLRLDVGDLMYFNNGANSNLSVKVGPTFHF